MIAVIFEVWPKPGHKQQYLDLAAELRPLLSTDRGLHFHRTFREPVRARQDALALVLPR